MNAYGLRRGRWSALVPYQSLSCLFVYILLLEKISVAKGSYVNYLLYIVKHNNSYLKQVPVAIIARGAAAATPTTHFPSLVLLLDLLERAPIPLDRTDAREALLAHRLQRLLLVHLRVSPTLGLRSPARALHALDGGRVNKVLKLDTLGRMPHTVYHDVPVRALAVGRRRQLTGVLATHYVMPTAEQWRG
jgi:hypothetical protein